MNEPTELETPLEASVEKYVLAVDLAHIFWSRWHVASHEAVNGAKAATTDTCRRIMAWDYDARAWCIDAPPYKRKEIRDDYKAQRDAPDPRAIQLYKEVQEWLVQQGELVLRAQGFEADDLIGALCSQKPKGHRLDIYSGDKDLLQLVRDDVTFISSKTEAKVTPKEVLAKYGVEPWEIPQLFALMGDKSDNIPGVPKVGPKKALELLQDFGDLEGIRKAAEDPAERRITPNMRTLLQEHVVQMTESYQLVRLMTDAPVKYADLFEEREPVEAESTPAPPDDDDDDVDSAPVQVGGPAPSGEPPQSLEEVPDLEPAKAPAKADTKEALKPEKPKEEKTVALAKAPPPAPLAKSALATMLEPRSMKQVHWLAQVAFQSGLFGSGPSGIQSIDAAIITMITGRELGLTAMASLRGIKIVEGHPFVMSQTLAGIILQSGLAEYFDCVETTPECATYATKRKGRDRETTLTYTIEEAEQAGLLAPTRSGKPSNWMKRPKTQLRHRAAAELARMVFPDICGGIYVPGEDVGSGPVDLNQPIDAEFLEESS